MDDAARASDGAGLSVSDLAGIDWDNESRRLMAQVAGDTSQHLTDRLPASGRPDDTSRLGDTRGMVPVRRRRNRFAPLPPVAMVPVQLMPNDPIAVPPMSQPTQPPKPADPPPASSLHTDLLFGAAEIAAEVEAASIETTPADAGSKFGTVPEQPHEIDRDTRSEALRLLREMSLGDD